MGKILKAGTTMAIALVAFAVAVPAQALITNADVANNAGINYSKLKLGGKIDSGDIKNGSIQGKDIKKGTITESKIKDDAITSDKIDDGTIVGGDLAGDIEIATTGDVTVGGVLTMDNSYLTDSSGTIDIGISGADVVNLNGDTTVDGDVLTATDSTNNLGAAATRWSTIYADTLNYATALTDANAGNTTVTMGGDAALDTVNITANTAITDGQWSVDNIGQATFTTVDSFGFDTPSAGNMRLGEQTAQWVYIGASAHSVDLMQYGNATHTGTLTTGNITAYGATADNALTVNAKGTGDITLGDADSNVTVASGLTVTAGGATITAGGVTITAGGLDMTGDNITDGGTITATTFVGALTGNASTATTAGTVTTAAQTSITSVGTLTGLASTGTVNFSGASAVVIPSGTATPGTCTTGQLFVDTDGAVGSKIMVCTATDTWSAN